MESMRCTKGVRFSRGMGASLCEGICHLENEFARIPSRQPWSRGSAGRVAELSSAGSRLIVPTEL